MIQATLDGMTVNMKRQVEADYKVAIPLSFKKLNPAVGDNSLVVSIVQALAELLEEPNKVAPP